MSDFGQKGGVIHAKMS